MNPQSPNTPHAMLPQPSVDQYPQAAAMPVQQMPAVPQYAPQVPGAQVSAAMPPQQAAPVSATPAAPAVPANDEAMDAVWVGKAREIIRGLQADPFAESMELGKLKAAYLKVRYGKEIKTGDDTQQ